VSRDTATPELIDAIGTRHAPARETPRIACFVPSITELVVALGLADRLVARTQFCIHPAAVVARIPAIGGTKKVSLPKLRALAPTHAILNVEENTRAMVEAMRDFVPHLVVTHPKRPEDNLDLYRLIGGIFGRSEAAEALCEKFSRALAALRARGKALKARRVVYFIWKEPWMRVAPASYIANMLALVNWHVEESRGGAVYPEVAITPRLVAETDLFLFSSEPYLFTAAELADFARGHDCPAEKLLLVDGEYCSWYGPRAIPALDYLGKLAGG
jgi:ABC-type Fe3+-hydroxamate transport system substrate-binding protein